MMLAAVTCLLALASVGSACMCMPSHPQEDICRENSFVALVKIRSQAYVTVYETDTEKDPLPAGLLTIVNKQTDRSDEEKDIDRKIFPTAPSNEMIVDEAIEKEKREANFIRYRIKIYKAYKGINTTLAESHKFYIYTSPDEGMCGRKLSVKGMYFIIGTIVDGRLTVSLCNHVIQWKSLPKIEKRNIKENMMSLQAVCQAGCEVKSCLWSDCKPESERECTWNNKMERKYGVKYQRANFLCVPGTKHGCEWNGVEIAKMEKRARRRRRRHSNLRHRRRHRAPKTRKVETNFMP